MVNAILSFLMPFEVVTMVLPTARFMQQAAEAPSYWVLQMRRAALLRENEEGEEEDEVLYQRLLLTNQNQRKRKIKLEYFRRMFLKPYQLVKDHESIDSCRVIIHGKVSVWVCGWCICMYVRAYV